ncbi:MAG: exosortase C-terminal domain/associated protein EpsI [Thermoanaerobaculia bacterium]
MSPVRPWHHAWLVAMALLLGTFAAYHLLEPRPVATRRDLSFLPTTLADWRGEPGDPRLEPLALPQADEEVARIYLGPAGRVARVYAGYYRSQQQGREVVSYTSAGVHRVATEVRLALAGPQAYPINRALLRDGREPRVLYFWYDLNGRVVANRYLAKLTTIADAIMRRRSNGAFVAVSLSLEADGEPAQMTEVEATFLRALFLVLRDFLPTEAV